MEHMEHPKNLPDTLKCQECDHTMPAPKHCGAPMHIEGNQLVCWMGTECGVKPLPKHHNKPMIFK